MISEPTFQFIKNDMEIMSEFLTFFKRNYVNFYDNFQNNFLTFFEWNLSQEKLFFRANFEGILRRWQRAKFREKTARIRRQKTTVLVVRKKGQFSAKNSAKKQRKNLPLSWRKRQPPTRQDICLRPMKSSLICGENLDKFRRTFRTVSGNGRDTFCCDTSGWFGHIKG